jgi:hypothetical protein
MDATAEVVSGIFTINNNKPPVITSHFPKGGETVPPEFTITWKATDPNDDKLKVSISYQFCEEGLCMPPEDLVNDMDNTGSYSVKLDPGQYLFTITVTEDRADPLSTEVSITEYVNVEEGAPPVVVDDDDTTDDDTADDDVADDDVEDDDTTTTGSGTGGKSSSMLPLIIILLILLVIGTIAIVAVIIVMKSKKKPKKEQPAPVPQAAEQPPVGPQEQQQYQQPVGPQQQYQQPVQPQAQQPAGTNCLSEYPTERQSLNPRKIYRRVWRLPSDH